MVEWLFLAVPWGCLRFVIMIFPDHTHLLFWIICMTLSTKVKVTKMSYYALFKISADICDRPPLIDPILVLTLTFDSRAIPEIQIISCNLPTSSKHCVKYE